MHKKSFFQGLGIGIVTVSVIFLILYSTRAKDEDTIKNDNAAVETETETESAASIMDLPDKNEPETESIGKIEDIEEIGTIKQFENKDLTISGEPFALSKNDDGDTVAFKIEDGEIAASVYDKLYELGVIDDETGFAEYVRKNNSTRKIASGEYKIQKGASYKEIFEMIKAD